MTLFVGGPHDGRDLPIPPKAKWLRLPPADELDEYLGLAESDPEVTGEQAWPYLYQLDESSDAPIYRLVEDS